ncbi:MAG: hypothetical protein D6690_09575 [Nitrospirae bacterium]|nr:MAG: hypothetical protein D6690_09575 [Nitrospirota bacterium]
MSNQSRQHRAEELGRISRVGELALLTFLFLSRLPRTCAHLADLCLIAVLALFPRLAAAEPLAVIVRIDTPVTQLTAGHVAAIYRGEQLYWPDGSRIKLVNREISSATRRQFYRQILQARPDQPFYRPGTPIPIQSFIRRTDRAVIQFVATIKGAIGYVARASLTADDLQAVKIVLRIPDP